MSFTRHTDFFKKFPIVSYGNETAVNLMKRIKLTDEVKQLYTTFYEYRLESGDTIQNLAWNYYKESELDWLIHLANDVVDPYHDMSISSDEDFEAMIVKKYGSKETALRTVLYYQNNWRKDDTILSTAGYQALSTNFNNDGTNPDEIGNRRKYWKPRIGYTGIVGYERNDIDYKISTNRIETYTIENSSGEFLRDEIVQSTSNSAVRATMSSSNSTNIIIKDIHGSFCANTDFVIQGKTSGKTATVLAFAPGADINTLNSISIRTVPDQGPVLVNVIPRTEVVYYEPVYAYDFELEKNENAKDIYLVESTFVSQITNDLTEILR
jgi:hypothetical protein